MNSDRVIDDVWRMHVAGKFLFRGMSAADLHDPMDPEYDPHVGIRNVLKDVLDGLSMMLAKGFRASLVETHFGNVYTHDLGDVVRWTRRDLGASGICFTSDSRAACEYADCYGGSQLKQNLKSIAELFDPARSGMLEHADLPIGLRGSLDIVRDWLSASLPRLHRPVVIRVRRSCSAFAPSCCGRTILPVGDMTAFRRRVRERLTAEGLPVSKENVEKVVPRGAFDAVLRRPLPEAMIDRVAQVGIPTWGDNE